MGDFERWAAGEELRRRYTSRRQAGAPVSAEAAAAHALGLTLPATTEQVRAAYVHAVKAAHPDSGGRGGDMALLKSARDVLLAALNHVVENTRRVACPMCLGRGIVYNGFSGGKCAMCAGKGYVDERS